MKIPIFILALSINAGGNNQTSRRRERQRRERQSRVIRQIANVPEQEIMVDGDSDGSLGSKAGDVCVICLEDSNQEEMVLCGCGEHHGPIHLECRETLIREELSHTPRRHPKCPICRRLIRLQVVDNNILEVQTEPSRAVTESR